MQNKNKPLLLRPSGKDYLWGGSRLNDEFEKNIDLTPLAETWECSTHPDGPSYVVGGAFDGQELAEVLSAHPEYLGERHKGENALPILIKFIDAKKDLSVQVHPTDAYAQERENGQLGKTEMWYVLDASKNAKLVYGLKRERTEQQMRDAIAKGTLMKDLQWVPVKKDDLFFIEAGTIHAIGAGALVAEIQENSNLTYRLYERWLENATADSDVVTELKTLDDTKIEDAFYRDLAFGTGGLRGVIGAGTNRMNVYTVAKASQGLADYLKKNYAEPSVAIGYDSRIKSDVFAKVAAGVFAANGVKVNIWPVLMPVPTVSFATRYLHTSAGVMVTASHNPSKYNGYKVYGADGCQITTEAAAEILAEIEKLDIFADVKTSDFEAAVANGGIQYIPDEVYTAFVEQVKSQSVLFGEEVNKNVAIVYSPLNGTGLKPVTRTLKEMGYTNITVVKEQEQPDGNFPTCPYPNPEIKEAMALGMEYAKKCNADLLLATDPDCDRVGIAVKNKAGEYELLTGNQTGMLLLDYICSQRVKHGKMPADPVMVKTIVTMDMGEQIATHYGLRTINVLTGFKFIGEQIGKLEQQGKADSYVFGFEESYGYLTGSYVRDKDGVDGAYMICEMFSYYATKGISLLDKLDDLYKTYGYCLNTLHSYEFDGSAGFAKMQSIMQAFRGDIKAFGGKKVIKLLDYAPGLDGLPKSDVLKFLLEDNCSIVVRPSGTEPKLKTYISVSAENKEAAEKIEAEICKSAEEHLK